VIGELGGDAGRAGAPTDHRISVRLRQRRAGELGSAAPDRAEQRPLGIVAQARAAEMGGEIFLEVVMIRAWSRRPACVVVSMLSSSARSRRIEHRRFTL
jgi:hypothetical protein